MSKNALIKGTFILTLAGLLTRVIGFFYRIFLSNAMGAEKLGIYQLVFPVYGICFTIYASGLQTSISRLVAAHAARGNYRNVKRILKIGLLISTSVALILSIIVFTNAEFIAVHLLSEPRSTMSLKILAVIFPFCGITSCINGYYYGLKRTGIPATTQLLEQVVRVIAVYFIASYIGNGDAVVTCELAVVGLVVGEIASNLYNIFSLLITEKPKSIVCKDQKCNESTEKSQSITSELVRMSVPLSANRLFLNILHSFEAVLIPAMLRRYGLNTSESLSIFGILNGMAFPFIMFPSAVTNALAVLLLPAISEAQAIGNNKLIGSTTTLAIKYTMIIGILSTGIFITFGDALGITIFNNEMAGDFLKTLAWLCPFIYLTTTLGSIINGLGKAHVTFINSVIAMTLRIVIIVFLIPAQGIKGYLIGLLISQLLNTILDAYIIIKEVHISFDAVNSILKPTLTVAFLSILMYRTYVFLVSTIHFPQVLILLSMCLVLCVAFLGFMIVEKAISLHDFK